MSEPSPAAGPAPQPPGTLTSSRYAIRSGEDESVFACSYHVPRPIRSGLLLDRDFQPGMTAGGPPRPSPAGISVAPALESPTSVPSYFRDRLAGALMLRWLSDSLMLAACLSLACLSGVTGLTLPSLTPSDTPGWIRMGSYGAIRASDSLAPQPPQGLGVANTSLAMMVPAPDRQLAVAMAASRPPTGSSADRSLTYLRTARLRL